MKRGELKLKVCGIVAEYNPFHNGHAYLINKARESGFTHVIAVMSGNFVQRGEHAVFETGKRAEAALRGGADLVIQLPVTSALSGARGFADGAVGILNSAGVVDSLVFGSECGDIGLLKQCSEVLADKKTDRLITEVLKSGVSYASARETALESVLPSLSEIIREPNNILAVEYIGALSKLGSGIEPVTFRRSIPHDSEEFSGEFASASAIRKMIKNNEDISAFIPDFYGENRIYNIVDSNRFEAAVLCNLRKMTAEDIAALPDISEGIENRIFSAARSSSSLDELYSLAKTKRYTHARIRRIVMSSFIGITAADSVSGEPYIRPLAMNDRGAELMSLMKDTASVPVLSRTSDVSGLPSPAQRIFSLECAATDLFTACLTRPLSPGLEKDRKIIKIS